MSHRPLLTTLSNVTSLLPGARRALALSMLGAIACSAAAPPAAVSPATAPAATHPPAPAPTDDPVTRRGFLRRDGEQIVDGARQPVRLRGVAFGNQVWGSKALPVTHHD